MTAISIGTGLGILIVGIILGGVTWLWRGERRDWNHGRCRQCGGLWYRGANEGWDWEGEYKWFECTQGHRIGLSWVRRDAEPLPGPEPEVLRKQLHATLSSWRHPDNGVRLDLIQRARTVIDAVADGDLAGLCLQHEDDDVIRIYRTRADDVFEKIRLHCTGSVTYSYEGPRGCKAVQAAVGADGAEIAAMLGSDVAKNPLDTGVAGT